MDSDDIKLRIRELESLIAEEARKRKAFKVIKVLFLKAYLRIT